jgi:hypothetical protein
VSGAQRLFCPDGEAVAFTKHLAQLHQKISSRRGPESRCALNDPTRPAPTTPTPKNFFHLPRIFFLTRVLPRRWRTGRDLELMLIQQGEIALYAALLSDREKSIVFAETCASNDPGGKKSL